VKIYAADWQYFRQTGLHSNSIGSRLWLLEKSLLTDKAATGQVAHYLLLVLVVALQNWEFTIYQKIEEATVSVSLIEKDLLAGEGEFCAVLDDAEKFLPLEFGENGGFD
jgi:hypothetical protein